MMVGRQIECFAGIGRYPNLCRPEIRQAREGTSQDGERPEARESRDSGTADRRRTTAEAEEYAFQGRKREGGMPRA